MRVRQRDIAQAAGVSQASVSLVVSGRASEGGISPSTQDRIRTAMEELGYRPDPVARSLRGGRSGLVGVFTYEPVFPARPDEYFHEFLVGIEMAAADRGQDLVLFSSTQQADGRRSIYAGGSSRLQHADGSVILGMHRDDDELARLAKDEYPFVSVGRYDPVPEAAWVEVDYDGAVRAIIEDFHRAGHRAIAYVAGDNARLPSLARRHAFAASTRGDTTQILTETEFDENTLGTWRDSGITAVIAENPDIAEKVERAAARAGLRVPDDFSAACLDTPLRSGRSASWSHLLIPKREVGIRSVNLLAAILDGKLPRGHHDSVQCASHHLGTIAAERV
ncbi:LacI family DNA-binding transcriptional regulator [Brachybacterium sp. FME24]|uniref:LacI family DNA-binding transcriptional regulator n=1 Tax=Brachybacterium sp. FME24 TaxID=2742605 RepID=UPI001D049C15|nr:LacI family DNA-binding transcriptional regulator [Brachybacterium sp. FME24]